MLHDPSHFTPQPIAEEIRLSPRDRDVLRRLATEIAEIVALPVHREKARLWRKLNDLESERPMVWINEICWHEGRQWRTDARHRASLARDRNATSAEHLSMGSSACDMMSTTTWNALALHSLDFGIIEDVERRDGLGQRHILRPLQDTDRDYRPDQIRMPWVSTTKRRPLPLRISRTPTRIMRRNGAEPYLYALDYLIRWWASRGHDDWWSARTWSTRRRSNGGRLRRTRPVC